MKRLLAVLLLAGVSFAQGGSRSNSAIKSTAGLSGATVRVCTTAASGTPCAPLATVYSDAALTTPIDQPVAADSYGNYSYYAAPGLYKEQVTVGASTVTQVVTVGVDGQNARISGGTIDGTAIGGTTAAAGAFTTLSATTGTFKVAGSVRYADQFAGANACAKITAALADLGGLGVVDARGITGAQTCTGLTIGTGQVVELGNATITTTGTILLTGNGARLVGLPPNLPGNGTAQQASVLKLDSGAASGTAVVNVRNASNAIVENLGIDANSVSSAIGVLYDSTAGQQGSTHGTFRNLDIRNAHQCFVNGDPSETATANSKQADYFVLDNWSCFGDGVDLTSEGFHMNNSYGGEASVVSRGGIGVVNKGIHLILGGAYIRFEGNTSTSGVGANAEFISIDSTDISGGLFVNNHTENTGWAYAFHDASCNTAWLTYARSNILLNNHWQHPVLIDGCNADISIGNKGASNVTRWTVGGTASVQSIGDTVYGAGVAYPWETTASGQLFRWEQDGWFTSEVINATGTGSQFGCTVTSGVCDFNAGPPGSTAIMRFNRLGASADIYWYEGNTGTQNMRLYDSSGQLQVRGAVQPMTAGAAAVGTTTLPWGGLYVGNATDNSVRLYVPTVTANRNLALPDGNSTVVMPASLSTTAATSDNVTVTGMTASGHCSLTATNASAATNIATTYVSAKAANQITVTHTATAGMAYDILCTVN